MKKKGEVPDYRIGMDDEVPYYGLDDLFDQPVLPENEKQIVPKPPTYEKSLLDLSEGKKQIYVDPQYLPEEPQDLPPEYDEDEGIDDALGEEDNANCILDELKLFNYDDIENQLKEPELDDTKIKAYLNNKLNEAKMSLKVKFHMHIKKVR